MGYSVIFFLVTNHYTRTLVELVIGNASVLELRHDVSHSLFTGREGSVITVSCGVAYVIVASCKDDVLGALLLTADGIVLIWSCWLDLM